MQKNKYINKNKNLSLKDKLYQQTEEIRKTNFFLNTLLENIPDMIFVKDASSLRFVRFNKAGEDLLGYNRDELIGKNDYDFFPKDEADFFTSKDRSVLASGNLLEIESETIHTKNKGERILHTKKIPIFDEHGNPEYLLGISEDITEKKQAELDRIRLHQAQLKQEEFERTLSLRDEFLSIVSHELKTPLAALKMQIQILTNIYSKPEFSDHPKSSILLRTLFNSSKQLDQFLELIENLLNISHLKTGALALSIKEVLLSDLIYNVFEKYEEKIKESKSMINITLDPTISGFWDPVRVEQVFVNLFTNAMKYGMGNPIEVTSYTKNNKAYFSIQDHGIGIAQEDHDRIFSRFERASSSKHFSGFGLGLYISHEIIKLHNGRIDVKSNLGQGALFTVELPLDSSPFLNTI